MTADAQKVILIVDDDVPTREMYAELFRANGFEVIEANDGIEGLDIATKREGIDVIFTGVIMPRMDGFQLISALKENTVTAGIPVVINSHLGREEDRLKALELGARDFIIRDVVSPVEALKRVLLVFSVEGKEYILKVDPLEQDGQLFITDLGLPEDFTCKNCGSQLAIKLTSNKESKLETVVVCPNCKKTY